MFTMIEEHIKVLIAERAIDIRGRMIGGNVYGIPVDDFMLEHVDFAIVCAYYLGTTDSTVPWKVYEDDVELKKEVT